MVFCNFGILSAHKNKTKISSHDFHFLPLFVAVLVNISPCLKQILCENFIHIRLLMCNPVAPKIANNVWIQYARNSRGHVSAVLNGLPHTYHEKKYNYLENIHSS